VISFDSGEAAAAYSDRGLDGVSEAFYAWFRNRPHQVLPAAATAAGAGPNSLTPPRSWASSVSCPTTAGSGVEPEMVNLDSDVVRAHSEWITGPNGRFLAEVGLPMPLLSPSTHCY
jgi:hypothetical protein